jgi:hypothetical protein
MGGGHVVCLLINAQNSTVKDVKNEFATGTTFQSQHGTSQKNVPSIGEGIRFNVRDTCFMKLVEMVQNIFCFLGKAMARVGLGSTCKGIEQSLKAQ